MDIERLSKSQIVLLTLLVSFVTSIATGIVTVSLMQQAPPVVAQTVNRIVEHTVQTVAPNAAQSASAAAASAPLVVPDLSQAIQKAMPSVVRLYASGDQSFLGLGVVLDTSGTIATDASAAGDETGILVKRSDGMYANASVVSRDSSTGVAYLAATSTGTTTLAWTPMGRSVTHLALGGAVTTFSGNAVARVGGGIVEAIIPANTPSPEIVDTGIAPQGIVPGSPLIDADGDLAGISTSVSRASSPASFVAAYSFAVPPSSDPGQ